MSHKESQSFSQPHAATPQPQGEVLDSIARALDGLRFGSVEITVHEGKVTFIERKEKVRLN